MATYPGIYGGPREAEKPIATASGGGSTPSSTESDAAKRAAIGGQLGQIQSQVDLLQSTISQRLQAKEDSNKLDERLGGLDPSLSEEANTPVNVPGQETTAADATTEEQSTDPYANIDEQEGQIEESYQADIDYTNEQFDRLQGLVDTSTNALLESIRATYRARISEMQQRNRALYGTKRQSGLRTGRSRYMQETEEAFLADEENAGLARIGQLEGEMLSLIAQAETARTKDSIDLLQDRMAELARVDEQMKQEVQNLHKNALARQEELRLQRKLELDEQKAEFEQGLKRADASARAVAEALGTFETDEEKYMYLEKAAEKLGVGTDILLSKTLEAMDDAEKQALDIRNIESQIASREASARTSAYNASLRERELALKERKASNEELGLDEEDLANLARAGVPEGMALDFQRAMQAGDDINAIKKHIADAKYQELIQGKISDWDVGTMETLDQGVQAKARKDADAYAEKMYNDFIKYFKDKNDTDDF